MSTVEVNKNLFESCEIHPTELSISEYVLAKYLKLHRGYSLVVYGGGNYGTVAIRFIKDVLKIKVDYVIDRSPKSCFIEDVPVLNLVEFKDKKGIEFCTFIATKAYENEEEKKKIDIYLKDAGSALNISLLYLLDEKIKVKWYLYFKENQQKFIEQYNLFEDDISRETYYAYLKSFLCGEVYTGPLFAEDDKYFGQEEERKLYRLENVVWANIGSFTGDTIFHFLCKNIDFRRIYAIEGDKSIVSSLKKNISMLSDEVKNKIEVINKYVGDNKEGLDNIIPNERITLINMDIEGAEAETLRASAKVIEENHPVLAICVYHKPEDLLEIPNIIREIYPGYKFFLRKYPSCVGNFYHAKCKVNELVLYAIPPEYMESW